MAKATRRYSAKLKFPVVLEALKGEKHPGQIAKAYRVHPNSVGYGSAGLWSGDPAGVRARRGEITYGWRLMVVVAGNEAQAKSNLGFPAIAAQATLSSTTSTVRVVTEGVWGPKYDELVQALDGLPLDVSTMNTG